MQLFYEFDFVSLLTLCQDKGYTVYGFISFKIT